MKTTKATFGLRDRNDDKSSSILPTIIASRDDVEQSYTGDDNNHHNRQRQTMSSTYHSSSRRYPLTPSKPQSLHYLHHHIKKLKNNIASRHTRVAFHFILGGIILYSLVNCIDSKRRMIRQRDIPSKSTVVEKVGDDIISSNEKTKSYHMFHANNSWENDMPGIDDLMDITKKLSQMFKAEHSSMSVSDKEVLTTDIHKAIAVMHIKVFRSDVGVVHTKVQNDVLVDDNVSGRHHEFTEKCNFVLNSMKEEYEDKDIEDFHWICTDNPLTESNLEWYFAKA